MAFFSKVGNVLRQTASASKQIIPNFSAASSPSFYQFIRCMSSNKVFVGGISFATDDQGLREAFSHYGEVVDAKVIMDRETSRSRGFGFVTFTSDEAASSAIQAMDGRDLQGRQVRVNYANESAPRSNFGGGGGYRDYGGGGGFGGGGNYGGDAGYVGGGANYGSGDGGNFGQSSGGSYGSSGSYGSGDGGNFSQPTGGNDGSAGANSFDSGSNFGVSGGVGGNDTFGADGGFASGQQFGSSGMDTVPREGDFRDDDEPEDFTKRA